MFVYASMGVCVCPLPPPLCRHFRDLMELFHVGGHIPDVNFLFLGNYVDRGDQAVEALSLLCCYKLRHPNRITLLRGGHESKAITRVSIYPTKPLLVPLSP